MALHLIFMKVIWYQVNNEDGVGFYPISWVVASFNNNKYFYPLHF